MEAVRKLEVARAAGSGQTRHDEKSEHWFCRRGENGGEHGPAACGFGLPGHCGLRSPHVIGRFSGGGTWLSGGGDAAGSDRRRGRDFHGGAGRCGDAGNFLRRRIPAQGRGRQGLHQLRDSESGRPRIRERGGAGGRCGNAGGEHGVQHHPGPAGHALSDGRRGRGGVRADGAAAQGHFRLAAPRRPGRAMPRKSRRW